MVRVLGVFENWIRRLRILWLQSGAGDSHAVEVQETSYKAYEDVKRIVETLQRSVDHNPTSLNHWASVSTYGKFPCKVANELRQRLGDPSYPPPRSFAIKVKSLKPSGTHKTIATVDVNMSGAACDLLSPLQE